MEYTRRYNKNPKTFYGRDKADKERIKRQTKNDFVGNGQKRSRQNCRLFQEKQNSDSVRFTERQGRIFRRLGFGYFESQRQKQMDAKINQRSDECFRKRRCENYIARQFENRQNQHAKKRRGRRAGYFKNASIQNQSRRTF